MNFGSVLYESKERVATITLNRPERFNAISETMPEDIAAAFGHANNDDSVHANKVKIILFASDLPNSRTALLTCSVQVYQRHFY